MPPIYETPRLLDEYLLFHYGRDEEILPWDFGPKEALGFARRTVSELLPEGMSGRALDVGCATGRSSFELSKTFGDVIGIDYSKTFIGAAEALRVAGTLSYQAAVEGRLSRSLAAVPPAGSRPKRVRFEHGDAMDLRENLGAFDVVHAANLICRLPEPMRFLRRLPDLVKPGGVLLLATPCTWLAEFTPPENQPRVSTLDWLEDTMAHAFTLERKKDLPFLIREHARKYQWSVSLGTVWRRL